MNQKKYIEIRKKLCFEKTFDKMAIHIASDIAIIALIVLLSAQNSSISLLLTSPFLAILCFRAFGIMHDAVHLNLSKSKSLNYWLGYFYGGLSFLPFEGWRDIHIQHHLWTGNYEKDPTAALVRNFDPNNKLKNNFHNLLWKSWLPILGLLQFMVFWKYNFQQLKLAVRQRKSKKHFILSFVIPLLTYVPILWLGGLDFVVYTALPGLFIFFTMIEIINFPHHLELLTSTGSKRHSFKDQYLFCRSCSYPKWFAHNILMNFNYHIEHHLYPDLPWHQLANANKIVKQELGLNYNDVKGNEWITKNRKRYLGDLLDPGSTKVTIQQKEIAV